MDRTIAPEIKEVSAVDIQQVEQQELSNGALLTTLNAGSQELLRLEFILKAGTKFQKSPLISTYTNGMLMEGTSKMKGKEINERIDFYGGFMNVEVTKDYGMIQVFVLSKYLENVLPIIADCIYDSQLPDREFGVMKSNKKSQYQVNSEKVEFVCRQEFSAKLFAGTGYGFAAKMEDYNSIALDQIKDFYQKHYVNGGLEVMVSGAISDSAMNYIQNFITSLPVNDGVEAQLYKRGDFRPEKVRIEKEGAIQSAIRIGRPMFTIDGGDYMKFKVLNTVLGGYFGSRLMSNIREDKGYTYGIGSALISYQDDGLFLIGTEVGKDVCDGALKEIYHELRRLRNELIPNEELDLVRNYMLGNIVRSLNGAFDMMDRYKEIKHCKKQYDFYPEFIETIKTVSNKDLQDLANTYLKESDLLEVVVG